MEKKCSVCGKVFDAARDTARYCSGGCKKKFQRLAGQVDSLEGQEVIFSGTKEVSGTDVEIGVMAKVLDLVKDLKLDIGKDLGITGWTADGIFIKPDVTIKQVQNIARLIHAKHGRACPVFRQCGA